MCSFIRTKELIVTVSPAPALLQAHAMDSLDTFFNNTTSHFYVVLTGTSSLLSGLMMFVEWLHYTYFGISIVDRLVCLILAFVPFTSYRKKENAANGRKNSETKPFRNSAMLFRGSEYLRYFILTGNEPLTEYDVRLTLQEFQSLFIYEGAQLEEHKQCEAIMSEAWKDRDRSRRIELALKSLEHHRNCPAAMILLAEERAFTIVDAEEQLRHAFKAAEVACKQSWVLCQQDSIYKPLHERNSNLYAYARLRIAVCCRKLGKLKEAAKIYRDLLRDDHTVAMANIQENLIECLLEMQGYSEVQQFLGKQDEVNILKSTVMCYTIALLKAKVVGDKFCPDVVSRRGPSQAELTAVDAIHRAVELNPHIPKYLLELKSLCFPPEHIFRRGDSEAVVYAFHHLVHWKRVDGALSLLSSTWEGTFRRIPFPLERGHLFHPYPADAEVVDRQLLIPQHELSVFPQRDTPFFMVFTGVLCFSFMTLTVVAYHFPHAMIQYAKMVTTLFLVTLEKVLPVDMFGFLS